MKDGYPDESTRTNAEMGLNIVAQYEPEIVRLIIACCDEGIFKKGIIHGCPDF
jgi:hypothetical protein